MHFALTKQELPGVVVRIDLVVLLEHHNGPYCPVVIVQEHASFCLLEDIEALVPLQGPFCADSFTLCPKFEIMLGDELNFLLRWPILPVETDADALRVRVVAYHLIQIVT